MRSTSAPLTKWIDANHCSITVCGHRLPYTVRQSRYDNAIELYQKAEDAGAKDVGPAIIMLARRTARLRAFVFWRDMERKRAKSPPPTTQQPKKPVADEKMTEKKPTAKWKPKSGSDPAPPVLETLLQRSRSIQAARRFIMRHFRYRKRMVITPRCLRCAGRGWIQPQRTYDPHSNTWGPWPPSVWCERCSRHGRYFSSEAARAAFWMTRTPLTRGSLKAQEWWMKREDYWYEQRDKIPWISRLQIRMVDYHGLWADVTWREWGARGMREKMRRIIRLGKRWYFYTPGYDEALYGMIKKDD